MLKKYLKGSTLPLFYFSNSLFFYKTCLIKKAKKVQKMLNLHPLEERINLDVLHGLLDQELKKKRGIKANFQYELENTDDIKLEGDIDSI